MKVVPRTDIRDAYVVVSGGRLHDVYLGPDVSFPRCSCEDATYTDNPQCRHVRWVQDWRKENA